MDAATTTLADSLLDDLDDLSDVDEKQETGTIDGEEQARSVEASGRILEGPDPAPVVPAGEVHDNMGCKYDAGRQQQSLGNLNGNNEVNGSKVTAISAVGKKGTAGRKRLLVDPSLKSHLSSIRSASRPSLGSDDDGEEHRLIINSNKHLSALSNELALAHGELCALYRPKFPELEELVVDPQQYVRAVRIIGNEMDMTKVNEGLNDVLNSNQIITISVAGSTTSGRPLTNEEMEDVDEAAAYIDSVTAIQRELTEFVEGRMESLAPSVCALAGPAIAARLLGLAGGLSELSRIPACNMQVLGQVRQSAASRGGMSSLHSKPHTGILAECDLVKRCPGYLQKKALKAVAAKIALAARCDSVNVESGRARSADAGRKFRAEIEAKISKWEEPDKARVLKALPKPDLTTKKRRGGKRIRRLKERFEETEMMKQANKRSFSTEVGEYGDDAMGLTLGMLDTKEGGNLRQTTEKRKMRQANTKASRKRAVQMSSGATNGLASSMVFTPVQGLELVNPDANRDKVREANLKWFADNAGFQSALPKK